MHSRILTLAAMLSFACPPASALNVSGHVIDKAETPLWSAKVCVKSDPSTCVTTDIGGAFHIQTAPGGIRAAAPGAAPYFMDSRNGMLSLASPSARKARLEWMGPGGRALGKPRDLDLSRGRNAIALPAGLPANGVCVIRLSMEDMTVTWKAVLMGSQGSGARPGAAAIRAVALSKVEAAGTLEVTKNGYKTRIYTPYTDPDTGAVIFLSLTADLGLDYAGTFHDKILSIDRTAKMIITQSVFAGCDSVTLVRDTVVDTSFYAFRDGKFWLWPKGSCASQVFTGTGADPVGTWALSDPNAELPSDLKAGCIPDTVGGNPPFETYSANFAITETSLTDNLSVEFCPANYYGPSVAYILSADSAVILDKNTCKQLVFKNAKNEPGTMNFVKQGKDSIQVSFTYKATTCSFVEPLHFGDEDPSCPPEDTFTPFIICMAGSKFSDSLTLAAPVAKASAATAAPILPMSMERRPWIPSAYGPGFPGLKARNVPLPSTLRESIFPFHGRRPRTAR
jgi:hypothetical protein